MKVVAALFNTTLGRKYLMAGSGVVLVLFVIGHMLGNLQVFLGPEVINRYAALLHASPELLWAVRIGLVTMVLVHLMAAATLTDQNQEARPAGYADQQLVDASLASRTMAVSGLIVLTFIIYHLLHFTVQVEAVNGTGVDFRTLHDETGHHDVYRMMITGFSHPAVAGFYLLGVGLLCLHLSHGTSAMFQSLGLRNAAYEQLIDRAAKLVAAGLFIGYASIPAAVYFGWLR